MNKAKWVVFGFALLLPTLATAAVPNQFTVQGVLRDNMGKLQSMQVMVTVKLFDMQMMGNHLGSYGPTAVMATNGLFSLVLTDNNIKTILASAPAVWLEVTAGNDTFPRQQVTPQFYALAAGNADTATNATQLGGMPASSYALANQLTGGTVTSVSAGTGLTGGPITTSGSLSVSFGGSGSASTVAHSDHGHSLACQTITGTTGAGCPSGWTLTGGGCIVPPNMGIRASYEINGTWQCDGPGPLTSQARCCQIQ